MYMYSPTACVPCHQHRPTLINPASNTPHHSDLETRLVDEAMRELLQYDTKNDCSTTDGPLGIKKSRQGFRGSTQRERDETRKLRC